MTGGTAMKFGVHAGLLIAALSRPMWCRSGQSLTTRRAGSRWSGRRGQDEPITLASVGRGLLDANVVGDAFAPPSADLILERIREVTVAARAVLPISRHEGAVINGMVPQR